MISTELTDNKGTKNVKETIFNKAFWFNFKMNLKSQKKFLIVMCVLHALGLPLFFISAIVCSVSDSYTMGGFIPLSVCCFGVAVLMGFSIALNSFDYLYKKSKVDMVYALPITTKQRFLSDYLSGLCAYTVPYIISVVVSLIIHGLACFASSDWATTNLTGLDDNGSITITRYTIQWAICGLLIMIMFYTLTVLITSCCGSQFEAIAYNVLANGLIPAVIAVFFLVFFEDIYGVSTSDYLLKYISTSSPIGALIGICSSNIKMEYFSSLLRWYISVILVDAIYFVVAYLLYRKRKAEDVSKPFVFRLFYYITMTVITFIIVAIMIAIDDADAIAPMLFFSAIVYFIFEAIANRGFKKFGLSVVRYIATVCGVVVLCLLLKGANGFGIGDKVPTASMVSSVEINYNGVYSTGSYDADTVTIKDKESIQEIIDFHKDAVENHFDSYHDDDNYDDDNNSDYYYWYYSKRVTLKYHTILGTEISREYYVSFEQYMMLKDLSLDDAYIKQNVEDFKEDLLNTYTEENDYYYNSSSKTPVEKRSYYLYVSSKLDMDSKMYQKLSYSQILELIDCYQQDLQNRTIDDILTPNDTYCYIGDYIIFDSYENTINFLTSNNYNPPTISSDAYDYTTEYYYEDAKLYKPSNVTCGDGTYYTPLVVVYANGGKALYDYNALIDLLGVAQPNYVTTEDCYMLQFGSDMYVIPPEYSQLAESIYNGKYSSTNNNSSSSSSKYLSYKAS